MNNKLQTIPVDSLTRMVRLSIMVAVCALFLGVPDALSQPAPGGSGTRITQPVSDALRVTLKGSRPPLARDNYDSGVAAADLTMGRMLLLLKPAQAGALAEYLRKVQDPAAVNYHKWLTPQQFGIRYGASRSDVQAVTGWLEQRGFSIGSVAVGGQWIEFSGTVAQTEAAFHTQIHTYSQNGLRHLANATELQIPAALSPVVAGVVSMNDFETRAAHAAGAASEGLNPTDFALMYHVNPLLKAGFDGAGQGVAVMERSNIQIADVETFRNQFLLPKNDPAVVVNGADPGRNADAMEALLDASWAGAVAPMAAVQVIVSASTRATDGIDLSIAYAVDHAVAPVIEVSYVACEPDLDPYHRQFYAAMWAQAAAEGITVVVSAGDHGAAACENEPGFAAPTSGFAVNGIASTAYDTAVGATSIGGLAAAVNGYLPESGWSDAESMQAGGGGVSSLYETPAWQVAAGVPGSDPDSPGRRLSSEHHRYVPDISFNAGDVSRGGETSAAAAAAFAGVMALVDEYTKSAQGNAAPVLYALARRGLAIHDVTAGSNRMVCAAGISGCDATGLMGYAAGAGFDLATGLGSIDATAFVENYASAATAGTETATISLTASSLTPAYGATLTATTLLQATTAGSTQPTGTVAFTVDSTAAGTALLTAGTASSTAALALPVPTPGKHTIGATYAGDANFAAVTATPVALVVQKGTSVTAMVADPAVLVSGTPETFTATITDAVSGVTPVLGFTGNVVFYDGTLPIGMQVNVTTNQAVLTGITLDPTVPHSITAQYYGDGNWVGSVSPAVTLAVVPTSSVTTLTTSSNSGLSGTLLTFTATVSGSATATSTAEPTGTVVFLDGTTPIGSSALVTNLGQAAAVFFTSKLSGGVHTITAKYQGDKNFAASTSAAVTVTIGSYSVTPNTTDLTVTAGQSVSVTFTMATALSVPIQFGCAGPPGIEAGCTFVPASLTGNGQTTMTITTTAATTTRSRNTAAPFGRGTGIFACFVLLSLPFGWRSNGMLRRGRLLLVGIFAVTLAVGCSTSTHVVTTPGTPSGTQVFTVTTSATVNDQTTTQHLYISVNVVQ